MGKYIEQTEHKKAVRCVQILAYISLIGVLADIVFFIMYSLRPEGVKDSYVFFITVLLSIIGCSLHAAVGISLPNNGKFAYYKAAICAFLVADFIGTIHGARSLALNSSEASDFSPWIFYTTFFVGCLTTNILILRFIIGSISRKPALIAAGMLALLIILHMGDIIHSMANYDSFVNDLPNKKNMIRLVSNLVFLICSLEIMVVVKIMPSEKDKDNDAKK